MRLFTQDETGGLQQALKDINLPDTATLYVSLGLNQVFRRVCLGSSEHFENSWLYIPGDVLNAAYAGIERQKGTTGNCISQEAIPADDFRLFPVWLNGQPVAIIADRKHSRLKLPRKGCNALLQAMSADETETFAHRL